MLAHACAVPLTHALAQANMLRIFKAALSAQEHDGDDGEMVRPAPVCAHAPVCAPASLLHHAGMR